MPPASDLRVEPGSFCQRDGTIVTMSQEGDKPGDGIVFVEPDNARQFVHDHASGHDIMMVVVPGVKCPIADATCQRFHIPVRLHDESKVVITACCHSLGRSPVTVKLSDGDSAAISASTKMMFVVWRNECPMETWSAILDAPIHTVFKTLSVQPAEAIAGPPQGRSWRANRLQVEPAEAESFCFYDRVLDTKLETILRKSGQDGIYTVPKSEHSNLADTRFSIVWAPQATRQDLVAKAESIPYALGIIRSSKEVPHLGCVFG